VERRLRQLAQTRREFDHKRDSRGPKWKRRSES
jgi:hypothetical protein